MEEKLPVLVGYATAAGSTRGVAERIAERLRDAGPAARPRTPRTT
jgi:menaquinone-dependent protoporphyrinogen IX oxidase